ncbi:hypothetical protein [Streptomyces oceani]|uniref:Uncharacterized protein n=1 Tax=Streptomyces oceani TaxID=1075402 RepID=A0A1E7KPV4_9ACTN|nr:hypothetical protein [Streptomyces oceani]OEV05924.1 hypothetical protein AN216_01240 [Streptomyces oceani]
MTGRLSVRWSASTPWAGSPEDRGRTGLLLGVGGLSLDGLVLALVLSGAANGDLAPLLLALLTAGKPVLGALGVLYGGLGFLRARRGAGERSGLALVSVVLGIAVLVTQLAWLGAVLPNLSTEHTMGPLERHSVLADAGNRLECPAVSVRS